MTTRQELEALVRKREAWSAERDHNATEGRKDDSEKNRLELFPADALIAISEILTFGARKYDAWNWAKGMSWGRLIGAAKRHLSAFELGEERDPESGRLHLAHFACCAVFLLVYQIRGLGTDDRHKWEGKSNG